MTELEGRALDHVVVLPLWEEEQASWMIGVRSKDREDDPSIYTVSSNEPIGSMSRVTLAVIMSETLEGGARSDERRGPLGEIVSGARGGYLDGSALPRIGDRYSELPSMAIPGFYDGPAHRLWGDDSTMLRFDGAGVQWLAANADAFARLKSLLTTIR
ncbi:MAG: hypothetical protein AB7P03_03450 [Kofleriaceae bacterium]